MARTKPVTPDQAKDAVKKIYDTLQQKMGGKVINIFQHMGIAPATLKGFMGLSAAENETSLSPKLREEIALTIAQVNHCNYCLSAHTVIAGGLGVPSTQILQARKGESPDPKTQAILKFVKVVVEKRGQVNDQDVSALKAAGVNDKELVELILVILVNMFTNYFNNIVDTPIDFPQAPKV
jgi:uncharacterized peroxidase-related enzyme